MSDMKSVSRTLQLVRAATKNEGQSGNTSSEEVLNRDELSLVDMLIKALRHKALVVLIFIPITISAVFLYFYAGTWSQRIATAEFNSTDTNTLFRYIDTILPGGDENRVIDNLVAYASRATSDLTSDEFLGFCYDQAWVDPRLAAVFGLKLSGEKPPYMDKETYNDIKKYLNTNVNITSPDKLAFLKIKSASSFGVIFKEDSPNAVTNSSEILVRIMSDYLASRELADINSARQLIKERQQNTTTDLLAYRVKREALQASIPPVEKAAYMDLVTALHAVQLAIAGNVALEMRFKGLVSDIENKLGRMSEKDKADDESVLLRRELAGLAYQQQVHKLEGYDEESYSSKQLNSALAETSKKLKDLVGKTQSSADSITLETSQRSLSEEVIANQAISLDSIRQENAYYNAKANKLTTILTDVRSQINDRLSKESKLADLDAILANKQKTIDVLENALARFDIADFKTLRRIKFLLRPVDNSGILPFPVFFVAASLLGLFLGLSAAYAKERNNPSLTTIRSLEELGVPVLGGLPATDTKLFDASSSEIDSVSLCYARMGINLGNVMSYVNSKIALFTSSESSLKSATITYNLGAYFAKTGRRTLIIETDFVNNYLSTMLGVPLTGGLSQIPLGSSEVNIKPFEVSRNLQILTGDATELSGVYRLASENFFDLLNELKKEFDYILIHARPCLECPDAADLSRYSGIAITCTNARTIKIKLLERLMVEMRLFLTKYSYFVLENAEDLGYSSKSHRSRNERAVKTMASKIKKIA